MKTPETELCSYGIEAARTAVREGVTRIELCASPTEGGVTPSAATIEMAREITQAAGAEAAKGSKGHRARPVELSVMIRPRGGDFVYSDDEFEQMKRDIAFARECGADGVVFGLLTPGGDVDAARTRQLVEAARPMESTFHRAFDVARDRHGALEDIIATGCRRILTSGQRPTAIEGIETIRDLVKAAAGRIEIMAGSGVNPCNARKLAATGVCALHFSAKAAHPGNTNRSEGEAVSADPAFVREMVAIG